MAKISSAWILGSTSEIARELCYQLAKKGCKKFYLIARNETKNEVLIAKLKKEFNVEIDSQTLDLNDKNYPKENSFKDYDLYIIATGFLGKNNKNIDNEREIFEVNFTFLIPWIKSICTRERVAKKGSLWIFSSVAGDKGRPSNYQYGAAKSALTIYCEGLANIYSGTDFSVRILKAGLINTKMSRKTGPSFLFTSKKTIAKILLRNPYKNGVEYLPFWWSFIMSIIKLTPSIFIKKL